MATAPKKTVPAKKTPVAKAAASAAKPAGKKPGTAMVAWEDEMRARASKIAKAEVVQSLTKKLGTRGGILTIDDTPVEDNELRVIIVGYVHENQLYTSDYDANNPTVPDCYSFSEPDADAPEDGMQPHENCDNPQGTDDPETGSHGGKCGDCWANKFNSADRGRGKACKNIRRLAVITEDALESAESLLEAEVRMLNVPVMSVKNWAKFANHINDEMGRPPEAVVCTVAVVPDAKSQFQITFKFEELINFDQELWTAMAKKRDEVNKQLISPYPKQEELDAAKQAVPVKAHGKLAQAMAKGGKGVPAKKGAAAKAPVKKSKF